VPVATIAAAVEGGVDAVHLRDHTASARELYARGLELRALDAWLIVNDRIDVAVALGADGVQLRESSLPLEEARRVAPDMRFGVSIHAPRETTADWAVLGSIYPTSSHPGGAALGPRGITPGVIAIGGITPENLPEVLAAGAHGVAVISAILGAPSPKDAARRFRELMG
jgi:thiamine-phosphate diphosphorylase